MENDLLESNSEAHLVLKQQRKVFHHFHVTILWGTKLASDDLKRFALIQGFFSHLGLNEPYNCVNLHSPYSKSSHYIKDSPQSLINALIN